MKNTQESQGIAREKEQRDRNMRTRASWLVGGFLHEKVNAYNSLNPSDTTFIYAGQVLEEKIKKEAVIGVVRNYPSFYHPGFCSDIYILPERYDLKRVINSLIHCLGGNAHQTRLFPYAGDVVGVDNEIRIVPLPKLRQRIQEIIESQSELDKYGVEGKSK